MEITTITDFRKHMKAYFEKVFQLGKPLFISRPQGEDIVLMSKSEYNSIMETFHLLKSPKNADRLMSAVAEDQNDSVRIEKLDD